MHIYFWKLSLVNENKQVKKTTKTQTNTNTKKTNTNTKTKPNQNTPQNAPEEISRCLYSKLVIYPELAVLS